MTENRETPATPKSVKDQRADIREVRDLFQRLANKPTALRSKTAMWQTLVEELDATLRLDDAEFEQGHAPSLEQTSPAAASAPSRGVEPPSAPAQLRYEVKHSIGVVGFAIIDRAKKEVHLSLNESPEVWGPPRTGFGGITHCQGYLNLLDFGEQSSKIPWVKLGPSLNGYTVKLSHGVRVEEPGDENCVKWFKEQGCQVPGH